MDLKELKLGSAELEKLMARAFPSSSGESFIKIEELRPGHARTRMPFRNWMLRPGNTISGPALFAAADTAMYVLVLAHIGPELMAVTSDLNMHFLNRGKPLGGPTELPGAFPTITVLHDCAHPSVLRFTTRAEPADWLAVREDNEPGPGDASEPPAIADGGGLASAPVCAAAPAK